MSIKFGKSTLKSPLNEHSNESFGDLEHKEEVINNQRKNKERSCKL